MKRIENKNYLMKRIETKLGGDIEEHLRRMFVDEHLSHHTIAKELGISYHCLIRWLKRAGVRSRRIQLGDE